MSSSQSSQHKQRPQQLQVGRLKLAVGRGQGRVSRSADPALPSPMTDLANNLSSASIAGSPPPQQRRSTHSSSDEADTPTTSVVLGGRPARSRRLLRDVSLGESPCGPSPASADSAAQLRRYRSLPLRQRLLAGSPDLASPSRDKENAPFLSPAAAKRLDGSFDFSSPKRTGLSERSGQRSSDGLCQRRLPLGVVQRSASCGAAPAATSSPMVCSSAAAAATEAPETQDPCSQDSGYDATDAADRDDFRFAAPTAPPPRRVRSSASSGSSGGSPLRRADSDGFMDAIDLDTMDESAMPCGLQSLLSAPILHSPAGDAVSSGGGGSADAAPTTRRRPAIRRFLSMDHAPSSADAERRARLSDRMPVPVQGRCGQFKRPEPPSLDTACSPTRKRLCSLAESPSPRSAAGELQRSESHRLSPVTERVIPLQRCHSESEASIKRAVQRLCQDPDLIGDCSRPYALPLTESTRNRDLKAISAHTLADLMDGKFADRVASFQVIDCRYPYEFEGGHIRGAVNLYTRDAIHSHLLAGRQAATPPAPVAAPDPTLRRHVLVFHCEFSSERGPSMYRFLREQDRKLNKQTYPALIHPEIYLLEGGYKKFYEAFAAQHDRCEPCGYKPMNKEGHESDLKHFRAKSKSWAGDSRARGVSKRMFL